MVKINVLQNGPCLVEAEGTYVLIRDGKEEVINQKAIALCRCGASGNKPFCDGSHKKINFEAEGVELQIR
ncbi:MAG: CDGSH iron-sulfur domain-containing protein [Calditrichaeota bacterium]|nr:CDGSH iron-sulfur domain-containing protein [Calditrichota bacterium]